MNSIIDYYRRLWDEIHTKAAQVRDPRTHRDFCIWIRSISNKMNCGTCKRHLKEYIDQNPPETAINDFTWTWEFHNDVNQRLGKPQMDYTTAAIRYLGWAT